MNINSISWSARLEKKTNWSPLFLGTMIALTYLIIRCVFDGFVLLALGFPIDFTPLWQDSKWWTELVNATLTGYMPAAIVSARRGFNRDLELLEPWLTQDDASIGRIRGLVNNAPGPVTRIITSLGLVGGFVLVFIDPSLYAGTEKSLGDPRFLWTLFRLPLFTWLVCTLIVFDLKATYAYLDLGRNFVKVDLLDVQSLDPFAHRGLQSALTWIIFSIIFSLFWLGDSASQQNIRLIIVLSLMATTGFAVPLLGVHAKIKAAKYLELDRLRDEIRNERSVVTDKLSSAQSSNPKLANLITYYHLIEQVREWPIDAANLIKFFIYTIIGLGSWLGGAVVERLLDNSLGG
jgi:hypothetical protein